MDRFSDEDPIQRIAGGNFRAQISEGRPRQGARDDKPSLSGHSDPKMADRKCLGHLIEAEIIPRILRAYDRPKTLEGKPAVGDSDGGANVSQGVTEFARIVITGDFSLAAAYVAGMRTNDQLSIEGLCADLLAPTARYLGELWEQDLADFAEVTLGLWRLQQILREFADVLPGKAPQRQCGLHALLLPGPGEQHTFGLSIVMEYFKRAGWEVWGGPAHLAAEIRQLVRDQWFDVVGFSVSSEKRIGPLASCIRSVRKASLNPSVGVLVGGRLLADFPDLAGKIGADLIAVDGKRAPLQAERLLASMSCATHEKRLRPAGRQKT